MEINFGNILKSAGRTLYESTPFDNVANMTRAAVAGDWGEAAKQLGYGAFDTALWLVPGSAAVKGGAAAAGLGKLGFRQALKELGAKQAGKLFLKGAISPTNKALVPGLSKGARLVAGFYGPVGLKGAFGQQLISPVAGAVLNNPVGATVAGTAINTVSPILSTVGKIPGVSEAGSLAWKLALKDVKPETTPGGPAVNMSYGANAAAPTAISTTPRPSVSQASAADVRMIEERQKAEAAAAQSIPPIEVSPMAPGGLMPLSPEQMQTMLEQERMLQKQYDNLLNQLALSEKQAALDATTARYGIQREAAGAAQDLATQLAAAGLDESPVSAIGAEQMVQGFRASQEAGVAKNLADLIAQMQQQRVQAGSDRDLGLLQLKQQADTNRILNTRDYLLNQYQTYGGV